MLVRNFALHPLIGQAPQQLGERFYRKHYVSYACGKHQKSLAYRNFRTRFLTCGGIIWNLLDQGSEKVAYSDANRNFFTGAYGPTIKSVYCLSTLNALITS